MTKITVNNVGSLIDATTAVATINSNNAIIQTAFDNTLSRDGTSPNTMGSNLDMNSFQILNLPEPVTANSPLRLQDLETFNGGGTISTLPTGGTTGQVLSKHSNVDFDTTWTNSVTSVGLGMPADFVISNSPVTTAGTLTASWLNTPTGTGAVVRAVAPTITGHPTIEGITSTGATGTGNLVFSNSPSLTTPALGTPSAAVLTNATGLPATSLTGLASGIGTFLATPTSANLAAALTDETGTGASVFAGSPTLTGTPLSTTAAVNTNTTQIATTAYVVGQAGTATPVIDGTGTVGTSLLYSRQDHIHPTDTSRQAADPQLFSNIPQNSQSAAYTLVLTDGEKHIYHPSADTTARTWTIPANSSVAYPVGTAITFINDASAGIVTIAITTDTLVLAGLGTTGSRTLAANGIATAIKMTSTRWMISGTGLT